MDSDTAYICSWQGETEVMSEENERRMAATSEVAGYLWDNYIEYGKEETPVLILLMMIQL